MIFLCGNVDTFFRKQKKKKLLILTTVSPTLVEVNE